MAAYSYAPTRICTVLGKNSMVTIAAGESIALTTFPVVRCAMSSVFVQRVIRFLAILTVSIPSVAYSRDFVLTIGGGYSPQGNQVSLEKNVLLFQNVLKGHSDQLERNDIYFASGNTSTKDLLVHDIDSVPEANRLMAEVFDSTDALGLTFRNHQIPNVRGAAKPNNIRTWFREVGSQMHKGDRLLVYVTAHGYRSRDTQRKHDTSIAMWDKTSLRMREFADLLDEMDPAVDVVMVMVQCYTGGFSHLIYEGGDPSNGLSPQSRTGFYATVHDRPAAGCTPDVNEANYEEYSTFFLAALMGADRSGSKIEPPDYDENGHVSLEEAHAYTILNAETIDLPVKTSGAFLRVESEFGNGGNQLLENDELFSTIMNLASPVQRKLLTQLSEKLDLTGENRIVDAWRRSRNDRRRRGPSRRGSNVRDRIASDLLVHWPELENPYNPLVTELLTTRSAEFVEAVQSHPDFERFRAESQQDPSRSNDQASKVMYERFLRVVDNVALEENLRRMGKPQKIKDYESIVEAEQRGLLRSK